jgi:DNA-directed RNA polymerase specialized sigma24 family protein
LEGKSIRELADELQIPADRVELRLRAAALYLEHQAQSGRIELPSRYRDHYGHPQ